VSDEAAPSKNEAPLKVFLKSMEALYKVYMPFLRNGGLFVPTNKKYELNDKVRLEVALLEEGNVFEVDGIVAWITPELAQQGRWLPGIGVQFPEDATQIRTRIETILVGALDADKPTSTM